jgi:hypothetical protein
VTTEQDSTTPPGEPKSLRIIIEVTAGLIPGGTPNPEYTQRYYILSDDWHQANGDETGLQLGRLLAERNGQAIGYAQYLMMQPSRVNWVRTDWIYL